VNNIPRSSLTNQATQRGAVALSGIPHINLPTLVGATLGERDTILGYVARQAPPLCQLTCPWRAPFQLHNEQAYTLKSPLRQEDLLFPTIVTTWSLSRNYKKQTLEEGKYNQKLNHKPS
jgi:hypothetical protein